MTINCVSSAKNFSSVPVLTEPAHKIIEEVCQRIISLLNEGSEYDSSEIKEQLSLLGVNSEDGDALDEMSSFLYDYSLHKKEIKIIPLVSGVFKLSTPERDIGVFKVGRKRAAMELTARFLAHQLGLSKHIISGMYFSMSGLDLAAYVDDQETVEKLWNGNQKLFSYQNPSDQTQSHSSSFDSSSKTLSNVTLSDDGSECDSDKTLFETSFHEIKSNNTSTDSSSSVYKEDVFFLGDSSDFPYENFKQDLEATGPFCNSNSEDDEIVFEKKTAINTARKVVGILQPYLPEEEKASLYDFTLMTITALAIGLRDGKKDGYKGSTLFDIEDNFPIRIDPVWTKEKVESSCSAIDLPYLDKDKRTRKKLSEDDVGKLCELVQKWDITEITEKLRGLTIVYEDKLAESATVGYNGRDEGGNEILIETPDPHLINGNLDSITSNSTRQILLKAQLNATATRLQRIHDFIVDCAMGGRVFSPEELIHAVDKWGKIYIDQITYSPHNVDIPKTVKHTLSSSGHFSVIGQQSPMGINLPIDDGAYESYSGSLTSSSEGIIPRSVEK